MDSKGPTYEELLEKVREYEIQEGIFRTIIQQIEALYAELASNQAEIEKKNEELEGERKKLSAILENIAEGLVVVDRRGRVIIANHVFCDFFGREIEKVYNQHISEVVDNRDLIAQITKILEEPYSTLSIEIQLKDGRIIKGNSSAILLDNVVLGVVSTFRDITYEVEIDRMKSNFLSTVSHELRTPLTSVLGFAKIIKKRLDEIIFPYTIADDKKVKRAIKQVSDNLEIIVAEGERLTALINNVLDLAKIESGRIEWREEDVDMVDVFERATAAMLSLVEGKGLYLRKEYEVGSAVVRGDRDRLIQVVTNLLSNAIKFTDRGGIVCRVGVREAVVRCEVEDSGCGIPTEMLEGVFEKFKQVGETLTERPKGTGLGLPICREIVKHHGGRIWAESEEGKGSRFIFELPLKGVDMTVEIPKEGLIESIQKHMEDRVGERILIVDDDSAIRSMLKQYLHDRGYETEEASDAKEAIGKARSLRPDLILLDIMMPGLSGYDVLRVLKNDEITRDIPVIVVSVLEDKQRALMLGASDYITKPVDERELFEKIRRVMGERTERRRKVVMIIDGDSETMVRLAEAMREKEFEVIESRGDREEIEDGLKKSPDLILVDVDILESFKELLEKEEIRQRLINTRFVYMIKGGRENVE